MIVRARVGCENLYVELKQNDGDTAKEGVVVNCIYNKNGCIREIPEVMGRNRLRYWKFESNCGMSGDEKGHREANPLYTKDFYRECND